MTQITELLVSYIDYTELNDHSASVVEVVRESGIEDPTLTEVTDMLSTENDSLSVAIKQERKNKYTALIKALDNLRDNWYTCVKGHVMSDISCPEFPFADAALRVFRILKNHGLNLHTKGYEKQSALLESLFTDLDKAPMQAHLATLGLVAKYEALKAAQKEFKSTYLERSTSESVKEIVIAASIVQKIVKDSLELVINYINISTMVSSKKALFEPLAIAVDHLVDNINTKIRARITAENNKREEKKDEKKHGKKNDDEQLNSVKP